MYGIDILLTEHALEPRLLEVQWAPDCDKALVVRPTFWDEVLSFLFLDDLLPCIIAI